MRTLIFSKIPSSEPSSEFATKEYIAHTYLFLISIIALIGVFIFDFYSPLGVAAGTPYALIVCGTLWIRGSQSTYIIAALGLTLTLLGFYVSPYAAAPIDVVIINRILAALLIVFAMVIVLKAKKAHYHLSILKTQSILDPDTQCKNKRAFEQELGFELQRNKRYKRHLSIGIFEIDEFNFFTLSHGKEEANKVIKNIAQEIKMLIRTTDTVYRIDNDRLAILFSETDLVKAKEVSEVICKKLSNNKAITSHQMTLSAGLSELKPSDSLEKLLIRTEKALRLAQKESGDLVSTLPQTLSMNRSAVPAILCRSRSEMPSTTN